MEAKAGSELSESSSMAEVTVIGSVISVYCTRVEWALKCKGVEQYEYINEDLMNKSPILLKYNPIHKKVPVLVHGGKPIVESLVILEYIDETWAQNPLLPKDPRDRAMARFWAKFSDDKCLREAYIACVAVGEEKEEAIKSAQEALQFLEKEISGKKYFGGEEIGYLDLAMGWLCYFMDVMEEVGEIKVFDADKFPSLHRWVHDLVQIPHIKQTIPPREKMIEYMTFAASYFHSIPAEEAMRLLRTR